MKHNTCCPWYGVETDKFDELDGVPCLCDEFADEKPRCWDNLTLNDQRIIAWDFLNPGFGAQSVAKMMVDHDERDFRIMKHRELNDAKHCQTFICPADFEVGGNMEGADNPDDLFD